MPRMVNGPDRPYGVHGPTRRTSAPPSPRRTRSPPATAGPGGTRRARRLFGDLRHAAPVSRNSADAAPARAASMVWITFRRDGEPDVPGVGRRPAYVEARRDTAGHPAVRRPDPCGHRPVRRPPRGLGRRPALSAPPDARTAVVGRAAPAAEAARLLGVPGVLGVLGALRAG
ncbi:hypothetical protein [Kitasatospora sp. NPDC059327]|uniref:hypothetical protein n=1 Tax=Kitasatospora sp. NPDC059327 TaxID=3346803 RepID=UPI0036CF29AF